MEKFEGSGDKLRGAGISLVVACGAGLELGSALEQRLAAEDVIGSAMLRQGCPHRINERVLLTNESATNRSGWADRR